MFIRGYSLHFFFVPEPVRRLVRRSAPVLRNVSEEGSGVGSFCEGGPVRRRFIEGGCLCGYESIMQNKANLLDTQMSVSSVKTKHYENIRLCRCGEKQTQSKPNKLEARRGGLACGELVEPYPTNSSIKNEQHNDFLYSIVGYSV